MCDRRLEHVEHITMYVVHKQVSVCTLKCYSFQTCYYSCPILYFTSHKQRFDIYFIIFIIYWPCSRSRNEIQALPSRARIEAHSMKPFLAAISKAVNPSLFTWSTWKRKRKCMVYLNQEKGMYGLPETGKRTIKY